MYSGRISRTTRSLTAWTSERLHQRIFLPHEGTRSHCLVHCRKRDMSETKRLRKDEDESQREGEIHKEREMAEHAKLEHDYGILDSTPNSTCVLDSRPNNRQTSKPPSAQHTNLSFVVSQRKPRRGTRTRAWQRKSTPSGHLQRSTSTGSTCRATR